MLGYEPSELIGLPMHSVLHHSRPDGSPYPAEDCPIYALFATAWSTVCNSEVFWRKDGTTSPWNISAHPIIVKGTSGRGRRRLP